MQRGAGTIVKCEFVNGLQIISDHNIVVIAVPNVSKRQRLNARLGVRFQIFPEILMVRISCCMVGNSFFGVLDFPLLRDCERKAVFGNVVGHDAVQKFGFAVFEPDNLFSVGFHKGIERT